MADVEEGGRVRMPTEDGLVKARRQATHSVLPHGTVIVGGAQFLEHPTHMAIDDIATVSVTVIPIQETFVRSWGHCVAGGSNRRCMSLMSTATVIWPVLAMLLLMILRCGNDKQYCCITCN